MTEQQFASATPESVGIPSRVITKLVRALREHELCMHGLLVFRHGKLVAEGYAPPFHAQRKHRMYSVSKSFTSLAVGLMADEGRITLDDRIVDHYPEYVPGPVHPFIAEATIRDMLTMRDCHNSTLSGLADWFSTPPTHPAGTVFMYNTTCTNLLCGIVEKISGMTLMEYLYPRLLDPIGFTPGCVCIKGAWGRSWSGSGILCTPRDLARVALVCLNGGRWNGRQLISEAYVREATSRQTDNTLGNSDVEHNAGYGYQIWRTRHNGFAFWGMGTQFAVALPDQDLLLVTTGDTQGTSPDTSIVLRTFWETVLASLSDAALPEDADAQAELKDALGGLSLPKATGETASSVMPRVSGKVYRLFDNESGWRDVKFEFYDGGGRVIYTNRRGVKEIPFGFGSHEGFVFPETHYPGLEVSKPRGTGYESYASAGWVDDRTLYILCYLTDDYCGNLRINAVFDGDRVTLYLRKHAERFLDDYTGWMYGYC